MTTEIILLIFFFLILDAFFAGSEVALTSLNKLRLRHLVESKNKRAIMVNNFLKREGHFLGTTLVGTNISVIASSALATYLFSFWFGKRGAVISTIVMTTTILICCEIIPKTIFRQSSTAISLKIIMPLKIMFRILYPLISVITALTDILLKPFKKRKQEEQKLFLTKKDIEEILRSSIKKGLVEPDEQMLIQRIFKLGVITVENIMIHLNQATLINVEDSIENLKRISRQTLFSRFPVYEREKKNIVGIINIYDLLFSTSLETDLKSYMHKPYFINKHERVDKVLTELKKKKRPMAIVIDKECNSVGLVTIEDLLEEIVGEIEG